MSWTAERQLILQAWPRWLAGREPEGMGAVVSMEDAAWGCSDGEEWKEWLQRSYSVWDTWAVAERAAAWRSAEHHFGPTLAHVLFGSPASRMRKPADKAEARQTMSLDIARLAGQIVQDFGFVCVGASAVSSTEWLKRQLLEAQQSLARLAAVVEQPHSQVGRGLLSLWFHEPDGEGGAVVSHPSDAIEVRGGAGGVAQAWFAWHLGTMDGERCAQAASSWRRSWRRSPRTHMDHQELFLKRSQRAFKSCMDNVDVTSDMGQKLFRRYRAMCKWMDDVHRGMSRDNIQQTWGKVKTGNRIAWAGEPAGPHMAVVSNWLWEEKLLEAAFWAAPQWHVPAWVQRARALAHDTWPRDMGDMDISTCVSLWALGGEAMVRQKIGYDGWLAAAHLCHPQHAELARFEEFYRESLL